MPDESTNPVWTSQASQNNQATTNQSWNDFVLDFWDLGDNDAPATEEVQIDSLSEEEKGGDELGFDIDLWTTDQNSSENTEETNSDRDNWVAKDVSIDTPEETINDFDISMDYEWTSEEENTAESTESVENGKEKVEDSEEIKPNEGEKVSENEKVVDEEPVDDNEEMVSDEETLDEEEVIEDDTLTFTTDDSNSNENVEDNEEMVQNEEASDENEIIPDEVLSFTTDDGDSKEKLENNEEIVSNNEEKLTENEGIVENSDVLEDLESQNDERHLFHQVDEEDQNQISFDTDYSNDGNQTFYNDESTTDNPLFVWTNDTPTNEPEWQEWEITLNSWEISNNDELLPDSGIEPETQKQPELGDLLSNSPIDLSKELNDNAEENTESDLWNMDMPADGVEAVNDSELEEASSGSVGFEPIAEDAISEQTPNEVSSEPVLDVVAPESVSQDVESDPAMSAENNGFLLDAPQVDPEAQKVEEIAQPENVENTVEVESQEQPQSDERSEVVNNAASQISEQNESTQEINVPTTVELSNVSSSQREISPSESENQVQSTLSLDQILDSELLSNPQYADNSKASPQNTPASGGKGKMWLIIGLWVAVLACCVVVLAYPWITNERKPGDTVDTWTTTEYPIENEQHGSAPSEPIEWETNLPTTENPEVDTPNLNPNVWGWWAEIVNIPDDEWDSWDEWTSTEPVPYVWSGDEDGKDTEEPTIEEVDANQILDVISSFKTQGEWYYSFAQWSSDNQLMKYSLRLINVCDNYTDKVNNGEGIDSESFSVFKSTANKILSKINTYLGGDEDVPVIREATIGDEYDFEWKDEIKDYLYNNR